MKLIRLSLVCLICGLLTITAGCKQDRVQVVNTTSGIVIHSSDFTNTQQAQKTPKARIEQVSPPTAKSTGNVIRLGDEYESIDIGPVF